VSDAATSLVVLGAVIALFAWNRLPVGVVAVLAALSLYATGLLSSDEALAGFGDPTVLFIAALFVVSEGVDAAGVTAWAGQALVTHAGTGRRRLTTATLLLCAVLTALITPNGAVAALLSVALVVSMRVAVSPSLLLMPLAFTAHAGSLLALTGSPVNVIVSDASRDAGQGGFGFFEFAAVGVPLVAVTLAVVVLLGPRLLPLRVSREVPPELSRHAETLAGHYGLQDGVYRLRVREQSPLVGIPPGDVQLADFPGTTVIGVQAGAGHPEPVGRLDVDDVLVVAGAREEISHLVVDRLLAVAMTPLGSAAGADLVTREMGVVEVVVPPRSPLLGEQVFPGMARGPELVVLAVRRLGKDRGARSTELAEGDSLLLHGAWEAIDGLVHDRDVLLVDSPDLLRRQAAPLGPRSWRAIAVLVGMVVLLATGAVPAAVAALSAATAMVVLRVVTAPQAYRAVSWQTIVLIGGLIPLSTAIQQSGAADDIADVLVDLVGDGRPYVLMVALFALTATLGQVVSNTATILIVVPIAVSAADETGVSAQPVLMLMAVAGAASFLTPIATPANMMVMGPGGYRFGDYWRLGLTLMVAWLAVALLVIPRVWSF
jgi:di/tricarboxylate transporter